jgi:hypothetical protein
MCEGQCIRAEALSASTTCTDTNQRQRGPRRLAGAVSDQQEAAPVGDVFAQGSNEKGVKFVPMS